MKKSLSIAASVFGGILVLLFLYVGFADLGRHKTRIERFLTSKAGRTITIAGPLHIRVLPSPTLQADGVRVANVTWGSSPAMIEVGHLATRVGFWSLIRGPVRVKKLEVADVQVVLEKSAAGENNWTLGGAGQARGAEQAKAAPAAAPTADGPQPSAEAGEPAPPAKAEEGGMPAVLENGHFRNVKVTYRQADHREHVITLDDMTVSTRPDGLLATKGQGHLDAYALSLGGQVGPLDALRSGKNIQMALESAVGNVTAKVDGRLSLGPLDGADLKLNVQSPDVSGWLKDLEAPPVVEGPLAVDAKLADRGERTALNVEASVGDIRGKVEGTLQSLALSGSELDVAAAVADVSRIATALEMKGVKPGELKVGAHVAATPAEIRARNVLATLNGTEVKADAVLRSAAASDQTVRFEVSGASLAGLYQGWPAIPFGAHGTYSGNGSVHRVPDLEARFGESDVAGSVSMQPKPRPRVEADLRSRSMDLTPFMSTKGKKGKKEAAPAADQESAEKKAESPAAPAEAQAPAQAAEQAPGEAAAEPRAAAAEAAPSPAAEEASAETQEKSDSTDAQAVADAASQQPAAKQQKGKFVFADEPLPLDVLATADVDVRFRAGRLKADTSVMTDVESRLTLDQGRLTLDAKGNGVAGGTAASEVQLTPAGKAAELRVRLDVHELKSGTLTAAGVDPAVGPATSLAVDLRVKGGSVRKMAAGANGTVLLTQSPGEVKSGVVDMFGSDLVSKIGGSLNPFAAKDKTTKLECTVARIDVVDGKATLDPMLMQSEKVVVTANGEVDLQTEGLKFKFNTKPRSGLGVSLGAITNAITELGGTLSSPMPGMGAAAKGGIKGALAVLTAGASVAVAGATDRVSGEQDRCADVLAKARAGPATKDGNEPEKAPPETSPETPKEPPSR